MEGGRQAVASVQSLSPKELKALPRGVSSTLNVAWVRTRGRALRKKLNITQCASGQSASVVVSHVQFSGLCWLCERRAREE